MPQGFPPAGSPQAFPGMRPPGGGNLRPPQMAQPGIGGPRPPLPGMQPPMHRPPGSMHRPPGLPPQQQPPRPQHPMQHVAQHSMQQPPVNQQRPAFPPQRPPLMHPPQPQRPMQQPGQVVGPPLQQPMLTPPRPQAAAGSQPHAAQAAHAPPPDIRQGPQQPAASGGTSNGSAPAGWIGHKSSDGQVSSIISRLLMSSNRLPVLKVVCCVLMLSLISQTSLELTSHRSVSQVYKV